MRELTGLTFRVQGALVRANADFATTKVSSALSSVPVGRGRFPAFTRALNAVKDGDASGVVAMAAERGGPIYEGTAGLASRLPTYSPMA
ncbi:MAG TPA: hypothetical protein VI320_33980 [Terracidiphilus sp.]|jgi:hypothetical protein